jgi:energy-coupling factor transport system permease protein
MSEDKLLCIFGGISPKLALLLSMSLRFLPLLNSQAKRIKDSQKAMGMYSSDAYIDRVKNTMRAYSSLVGWALENAIDVGTSMKSRGYGLKARTAFSIYRFDERDKYTLAWLSFCGLFLVAGTILNAFGFRYFPDIRYVAFDMTTIPFYCVYSALCITPVILNLKEERKWKTSVSEM